ncbi:MAG: aldehyde-activating protein [Acidocella sp. 20-63-7]|nr:MAG: aldehyde-activating protein [Acidocella sp. 20-63-7]HQT46109.1 GFA family protein [Acidocella sp.]
MTKTYSGACFCGAVAIEASGEAEAMGYCHCRSCRSWSAGPVNAFTLWKPEAIRVVQGEAEIGSYAKTDASHREFCKKCGGHVLTRHPGFGLVDVFAATLPELAFEPQLHVNYGETVLHMHDGLPKLKDFPEALGGSGEMLPE